MNEYEVNGNFSVTGFIESIVKRSDRSATFLALPRCYTEEVLVYVADECPDLNVLLLPFDFHQEHIFNIQNLVSKWKNLQFLRLGNCIQMQEVIAQISLLCKNFVGLDVTRANIGEDEASATVTLLPNIKYLGLTHACMEKKYLVMILQGCKELVEFDARDCIGFNEGDDEILKLASHIDTFKLEGSTFDDFGSMFDNYNDDPLAYYDDFHDDILLL